MGLGWLDVRDLPFHALALLERFQLRRLIPSPRDEGYRSLAIALQHHPVVVDCLRWKCPEIAGRLDEILSVETGPQSPEEVRRHEVHVLEAVQDWLCYLLDPAGYDALPFLGWDADELLSLVDFRGKTVLDVGAGTGRLAFTVAPLARTVHACEPVENLRNYLWERAASLGLDNVYAVDGLITRIPFPDDSFDVTMGAHVFGDEPAIECAEMARVTRPGGRVILCPGNLDRDDATHAFLVGRGFEWSRFEQPGDGLKRKYWKTLEP
ncbi:MAG: class I SAM-dependent methyltransferase [Planctomycetota bacterium]|jgi:SAM-dependent methyltransferase